MRYAKWLAGVLAALAFATPAEAAGPFDRPVTDPFALYSLHVARGYWGVDLGEVEMLWDTGADIAADAWEGNIYLFPGWLKQGRVRRCETIVHEYGHLLGHGHTRTTRSIMSPVRDTGIVPGCRYPTKGTLGTFERVRR